MLRLLGSLAPALLLAAGLCICGCRVPEVRLPETGATLEGTITLGGNSVPMAMVIVMGASGSATGFVGDDGRYKVENVPLGEVKIGVNTDAVRGQLISQSMARSYKGPDGKSGAKPPPPKFVAVPAKYFEPASSGISTTVKSGTNTYDVVLK